MKERKYTLGDMVRHHLLFSDAYHPDKAVPYSCVYAIYFAEEKDEGIVVRLTTDAEGQDVALLHLSEEGLTKATITYCEMLSNHDEYLVEGRKLSSNDFHRIWGRWERV